MAGHVYWPSNPATRNFPLRKLNNGLAHYQNQVNASIGNGSEAFISDMRNICVGCKLDDGSIVDGSSLAIYPRPAIDMITIQSFEGNMQSITIFDVEGREIWNQSEIDESRIQLDIHTWIPGIYFAKVITQSGQFSSKIIVGK